MVHTSLEEMAVASSRYVVGIDLGTTNSAGLRGHRRAEGEDAQSRSALRPAGGAAGRVETAAAAVVSLSARTRTSCRPAV